MKKKVIAALLTVLLVGGSITGVSLWKKGGTSSSDNVVYVGSVSYLTSMSDSLGVSNRYSGVVESENTWKVNKDSERTVSELLVEAGQQVKKGDILFTYDTDEVQTKIEEATLELERIANEKSGLETNIQELEKERSKASGDQKTTLTLEIQEAQLDLKKKEYEAKQKQNEIDKLKASVEKSEVISEIDGIVKSVNKGDSSYSGSESDAFITIVSVGAYQVKAKINEQNLGRGEITEGTPVIVHSRVDEKLIWTGVVDRIDLENASQGNNYYYGNSDSMTSSSSYPFYIKLDSSEGLMLGQHVYVEKDYGIGEQVEHEGLWLSESFLVEEDGEYYVWADNGSGKLVKKPIVIGERDESTWEVQILEGLTEEDCITWPESGLEEGMPTSVTTDGTLGQSNPDYGDLEYTEDELYEDGAAEDELSDGTESQSEVE